MKNLKTKLQSLRQRAEQLKQVVESAPARAERLRGAVHSAAGQFQQLRSEVQGTVSALRMNDDTQLAAALVEINDSEDVFLDAGYHLTGVDMEPGMAPRLLVHFEKLEDVRESTLQRLQSEHRSRPTLNALLSAMMKAEAAAGSVRMSGLVYSRLTVHVGPVPTIQIGWRPPEDEQPPLRFESGAIGAPAAAAPPPLPGATPALSFFTTNSPSPADPASDPASEAPASASPSAKPAVGPQTVRRPSPTPSRVAPITVSTAGRSSATPRRAVPATTGDWRKDALAKFKAMPDLGR